MVPAALLDAVDRPPISFMMLLANAGVPAGIELREADDIRPPGPFMHLGDDDRHVPIETLVGRFNARLPWAAS